MNLQNDRPHRIDLMPRLESSSSFSNPGRSGFTDAKRWKTSFEFLVIVLEKMKSHRSMIFVTDSGRVSRRFVAH